MGAVAAVVPGGGKSARGISAAAATAARGACASGTSVAARGGAGLAHEVGYGSGATIAAATACPGHRTAVAQDVGAALRCQHSQDGRDAIVAASLLANALAELATAVEGD